MTHGGTIALPKGTMTYEVYRIPEPFTLDSGTRIPSVEVAYETYGELNRDGTNAVLVCHALTGSSHAADIGPPGTPPGGLPGWWNGIIGKGKGLDPDRDFIVCSNLLGSCYGTTGPTSVNPATGVPYRSAFPRVTVRDMVRLQHRLLEHLGVSRLRTVIGGSLGGMQVLEWALLFPANVDSIIPIGTATRHTAWAIGWNEASRLAIMNDPAWLGGEYDTQPAAGLALARIIAMISYRSGVSFQERFGREVVPRNGSVRTGMYADYPLTYQVESYLRHQGQKLVDRFDANSYIVLTNAMDAHDICYDRGPEPEVLGSIRTRTLSIGISSDVLYPAADMKALAKGIPEARYAEISSIHGHDAFLLEFDQLNNLLASFLH